jgi:hypothetical protein
MLPTTRRFVPVLALVATLGVVTVANDANASVYPTVKCVSTKLKEAATKCQKDLKAWSGWDKDQDAAKRDAKLLATSIKFTDKWAGAESKSASKGADCVETTLSSSAMAALIDAAVNDIKDTINGGLVLSNPDDGKCGSKLIKAAATKCQKFLKAESKYISKLATDPTGAARTAAQSTASTKFSTAWGNAAVDCPTTATEAGIEGKVDQLTADVVFNSTVSPSVSQTVTMISVPVGTTIPYEDRDLQPVCSRDTPYAYFVKRGTNNKLLMYYQGGGACWDATTCARSIGAFDDDVNMQCAGGPNSGAGCINNSECPSSTCYQNPNGPDNPANFTAGFGDMNNPSNPFKDWNVVFVSYCTGDVHWGDNQMVYSSGSFGTYGINHKGYINAKVAEKWAREHFVNPDEIFVTGSSAGAYGAVLHGVLLHEVYPASQFSVLGDAGNGVITQQFLQNNLDASWHVQQNLPTYIGLNTDITQLTIADLYIAGANYYAPRDSRFAQYTTAWDGGGGSQTFFYNVMVNGVLDANNWWHSSCPWNAQMRQYSQDASAGASNYHYYIGPGSRHTVWGSNRAYTETHGGIPLLVDWVNDMRVGGAGWVDVECTDCSLLGVCDNASTNAGDSCQHNAECIGGSCTLADPHPNVGQNPPNPYQGDGVMLCPTPTATPTPGPTSTP